MACRRKAGCQTPETPAHSRKEERPMKKEKKHSRAAIIVLVVLVALVAIGGGVWFLLSEADLSERRR